MEAAERGKWTLLTSHGHVLVEIARNPKSRVRDISAAIGITERATQAIIADLERAGYVERLRIGRRTHYVLNPDNPFRHSAQDGLQVGPFLELLTGVGLLTDPAQLAGTGLSPGAGQLTGTTAQLADVAKIMDTAEPAVPAMEESFPAVGKIAEAESG